MPTRIKGTDLIYSPVPKVACTSVKMAILRHQAPEIVALLEKKSRVAA